MGSKSVEKVRLQSLRSSRIPPVCVYQKKTLGPTNSTENFSRSNRLERGILLNLGTDFRVLQVWSSQPLIAWSNWKVACKWDIPTINSSPGLFTTIRPVQSGEGATNIGGLVAWEGSPDSKECRWSTHHDQQEKSWKKNVFPTELTPGRGPKSNISRSYLSPIPGPVPPGHYLGVAKKTLVHLDKAIPSSAGAASCRQCQPELGTRGWTPKCSVYAQAAQGSFKTHPYDINRKWWVHAKLVTLKPCI